MLQNDGLLYDPGDKIRVHSEEAPLYYNIDCIERTSDISMEFQHFHDMYEVYILLDGPATYILEGEYHSLQRYDIVLVRPMLLHKTEYPKGQPAKRLLLQFSLPSDALGPLSADLDEVLHFFSAEVPILRLPSGVRSQLFEPLNQIHQYTRSTAPHQDLLVHAKCLEFLCLLSRFRSENIYIPQRPDDTIAQKIYTVTSHIHANYPHDLSLDALAKLIYVSPYYLSHQFKQVTGFTVVNYVQMTRIRNAQQYLLYSNYKISEITELCGFTSFSQFNRVFHKFCQVSPSKYRAGGNTGRSPAVIEPPV